LARYYPLTTIVIEDVEATTRPGQRRWNTSFSPFEVGKAWGYGELEKIAPVHKVPSYVTKTLREEAGLHKSGAKVSERWDAHCVDAFVLANCAAAGPREPTSTQLLVIVPLQFHRRQLHRFNLRTGGRPAPYGGDKEPGPEARIVGPAHTALAGVCGRNITRTDQPAQHGDRTAPHTAGKGRGLSIALHRLVTHPIRAQAR
jgi:hypothetical protein